MENALWAKAAGALDLRNAVNAVPDGTLAKDLQPAMLGNIIKHFSAYPDLKVHMQNIALTKDVNDVLVYFKSQDSKNRFMEYV